MEPGGDGVARRRPCGRHVSPRLETLGRLVAKRPPRPKARSGGPVLPLAAGPPRADEGNDDGSGAAFLPKILQTRSLPTDLGPWTLDLLKSDHRFEMNDHGAGVEA